MTLQQKPTHAKKVFEGVLFDIFQWEQEMYDGSKVTFEQAVKCHSTCIIAIIDGHVMVTKQEQPCEVHPFIGLPAGRIERDETPEENAHKELFEEVGVECDSLNLIKTFEYGFKMDYKCYVYLADNPRILSEPSPDSGEKIEVMKVPLAEFFEMVSNNTLRESRMLKSVFNNELSKECEERMMDILLEKITVRQ